MRVILLLLCLLPLSACATARNDRIWDPYLAHTTHVARTDGAVSVSPVIDWSYDANGPVAQHSYEAQFALGDVRNVYFAIEPQPGNDMAAHTFLVFELAGDQLLGVTIEARLEAHEQYDVWAGVWNSYELAYVWGSARDLMTRRAVFLQHNLLLYPLAITDEQKRTLLSNLIDRTQELETAPRFYNTLFSNCTNELAKATSLAWHSSFVFTGNADNHLYSLGLIGGASFEEARERADIAAFVKNLNAIPAAEFDAALLAELRRRNPALAP